MKIFLFLFLPAVIIAQSDFQNKIDQTYTYAKKGIYYALENIPDDKSTLNEDLLDNDKLICEVRLTKEINGVKIIAKGFFDSYETEITVYKTYDNLVKEGYLKKIPKD